MKKSQFVKQGNAICETMQTERAGQAKEVAAIVAAFEDGVSKVEAEPAGPKTVSAFEQANEKAAAYGLISCSV